jgi:hypothetical protein
VAPCSPSVANCSSSSSSGPTTLDGSDSAASLAPCERSCVASSQQLCSSRRHQKHDWTRRKRVLFGALFGPRLHAQSLSAVGFRRPRAYIRDYLGRLWREAQEAEEGENSEAVYLCFR